MITHFYFKKITQENKEKLKIYTNKKLKRLTRLLQHKNLELCDFFLRAEYFTHHNAFSVKLNLKITKYELSSEEKSHDLLKAFDLAFDSLINQLRKLEDKNKEINT